MKFIFEAWEGGRCVGHHEVNAQSETEAWQKFGMGLADYPPRVQITCRPDTPIAPDLSLTLPNSDQNNSVQANGI